jgi:hypothetical protein
MDFIPSGYLRLDEAYDRFCVEKRMEKGSERSLSDFANWFASGQGEAFLREDGELRRIPRERWDYASGKALGLLRGCWASASFLGDGRQAPIFVLGPNATAKSRTPITSGIPAECITTAEMCAMVHANRALLKEALERFAAEKPGVTRKLRERAESDSRSDGGEAMVGVAAADELDQMAVAQFVLMALHDGRVELVHRDPANGERIRFDARHFQDSVTGYHDIRMGTAPLFGPHEYRDLLLFLPRGTAEEWVRREFQSLARAPFPPGFVKWEYIQKRLALYCGQKKDFAHGVVVPGTDQFGNWTNSEDETEGRLRAQVERHVLEALKSGTLRAAFWRADSGLLLQLKPDEWCVLPGDGGRACLRCQIPPDLGRALSAGADMNGEAVMFNHLIFARDAAEAFLRDHAPRPTKEQSVVRRGRRAVYDWAACFACLDECFAHHSELSPDDPVWNAQADVEKAALRFFSERNQSPAESHLRTKVAKYLRDRQSRTAGR